MKLYILRPVQTRDYGGGQTGYTWGDDYDVAIGFVVAARNEREARELASKGAGVETADAWLSSEKSTCSELKAGSEARVVMRDFLYA